MDSTAAAPSLSDEDRLETLATPSLTTLKISPELSFGYTATTFEAICSTENSARWKSRQFHCYRCGCEGRVSKLVTVDGKSKVVPLRCPCAQCKGESRCEFSNIDQCVICNERYEMDEKHNDFSCPARCRDPPVSNYSKRFLSLSAADINTPLPPWKRTLLHSAVAAGDAPLCWHLLKRGANPFACDYLGVSPMALATSMLPVEEETNCTADRSYKSVIAIYHMLPKMHCSAFEYIEHLCQSRRMDRGYSMGDYHLPIGPAHFSGLTSPQGTSSGTGPMSCPTECSRGRSDSLKGSVDNSPRRPSIHSDTKSYKHRKIPRRNRALSMMEGSLSKLTCRNKLYQQRGERTWAEVAAKAALRDPVHSSNASPSTILLLPSHRDSMRYNQAVKHWTEVVREEGRTHVLLDSGLQTFTPLTISRLMDTAIDSYRTGSGDGVDIISADGISAGSSFTCRMLSGDMFVINEDGGVGPSLVSPRGHTASKDETSSPSRDRSWSQTTIGSPTGTRARTISLTDTTIGRRRSYSEAEKGGSRVLLRHCTLYELRRAVLDNDQVHVDETGSQLNVSSEVELDGELLFSCSACLDCMNSSEFAFSCHRMGCNGNLCRDCLYRSLVVSVSSALYAVPMVRCPGKCHGRVPTNAWIYELDGITPTQQEVDTLVVTTTETKASLLEGMRLSLNRCLEMELEVYHNPDSDDCQHHRDIMGRSAEDFFIKTRQLLALSGASFRDIYAAATKETTCQTSMATLQEIAEQLATIPSRDRMEYDRLFGLSKYDMHDTLQATMSKINSEDISTANEMSECVSLFEPVVTAFIIHIYKSHSSLLPAAELAMDEMDQKLNDAPTLSASQLLLGRYKHNAEALLMMRCGKCDKSVSLLYSKNLHVEMTARQKSLLDLLAPFKEDDQITLLRGFVAFSGASIAPATFISALFCIWAKVRPPSLVELCDSGVLHTDLAAFMESVIVMLVDIERRLAAQLALYRAYPKVYVACCGSAHCFMCKVKGHHAGKTCEDVQSELIGTEAQYCPGCGVPTLRTEGCHQILCVCGMSWQWKGGDDPNDVNYNFNDGGSDSFDDIEDDENSFNSSESDIDVA